MNNIENLKNKINSLESENRCLKLKVKSYEDAFERLKDIQGDLDNLDDEGYDGYNGY